MLTVAKVTGAAAAGYADYLEAKTGAAEVGDYYLRDGERVEAPGRWLAGAEAVGADPEESVSGEQLRALLEVRRPDTGLPLRPVGASGTAVAALDATFSAPKSVSAVWALAGPQLRAAVERAHETAIDRALRYAVAHVPMIRERLDPETVIHVRPAGVVASSWRHTTARAVNDRPPDPQLHSHVLLHAGVRRDGRLAAIDSRRWLVHRRELGAAYRTEFAHELSRHGFEIQRGTGRGGRYFELAGVPETLTDRWSSRHHQVRNAIDARLREKREELETIIARGAEEARDARARLEQLDASVRLAPAEERFMSQATRGAKLLTTHADLDRHWRREAHDAGVDSRDVHRLTGHEQAAPPADRARLTAGLTEFDATFAGHEARAVALEVAVGAPIGEGLRTLDQLREAGELLELAGGRLTTRAHRAQEQATVTAVARLASARVPAVADGLVQQEVSRLDHQLRAAGQSLTAEQSDAIIAACGDRQLILIEGQAGTGKSTVLSAVARAHQADGRQIIVTSTAALAAQRLADELQDAGVPTTAYSTAGLHAAMAAGRVELDERTTVIHDEAALASTREQRRLFAAVNQSGARLIEVGDPQQSRPVGAGGLWTNVEEAAHAAQGRVELTRNVRAHDPEDRRDQKRFRDGDAQQALAGYHARARVTIADDPRRGEDRALEAAETDRRSGRRTVVIAQTSNEHLDALNARAQAIRHQAGDLGGDALPVPGRPYHLRAGDPVQVRRSFAHPDHEAPIRNGTAGQITDVNPDTGHVRLQAGDGQHVVFDRDQLRAADLRLAYVQHPFPAQGQTTDTAHLIVTDQATQEGSYVALSRARDRTDIYAATHLTSEFQGEDPIAALAVRMSRTEPEVPSIDLPLAHELQIAATPDPSNDLSGGPPNGGSGPATLEQTPGYLVVALGPRPEPTDPRHGTWCEGANAIGRYRARYMITDDDPRPLGAIPAGGLFQQRSDRTRAARPLAQTARQLGIDTSDRKATRPRDADHDQLANEPTEGRSTGYEP